MYLLIDNGAERALAPFAERFVLSTNPETIEKLALERGWETWLGKPNVVGIKVGHCHQFTCGDVDLKIFHLEPRQ